MGNIAQNCELPHYKFREKQQLYVHQSDINKVSKP